MSAVDDLKRTWYRHVTTGERGYLVEVDGQEMIRLDRPQEEILRPLRGGQWTVDRDYRPLTPYQVGQISWAAHQRLAFFLGLPDAKKAWIDLRDEERRAWIAGKDVDPKIAAMLRQVIVDTLEVLTA